MSGVTLPSSPVGERILQSADSYYELDLPHLPKESIDSDPPGTKIYQNFLSKKPQRPTDGNSIDVKKKKNNSSSSQELQVILEELDDKHLQSSDEEEISITNEERNEIVRSRNTKVTPKNDKSAVHGYTVLRKHLLQEDDIYTIPSTSFSHEDRLYLSSSPDSPDYQTRYIKVGDDNKFRGSGDHKRKIKESAPPWNLRETLHHKYMMMKMVGMEGCCGSSSHKGAKKFFAFLIGAIILLLVAIGGVVLGLVTWKSLEAETNTLQDNFDKYTTSLTKCRVGRNWTSVVINETSLSIQLNFTNVGTAQNGSLTDVYNLPNSTNQVLLYIIITTSETNKSTTEGSHVILSMWTRSMTKKQSFRQYMSVLNNANHSQLASQSFWFPYHHEDDHLYVRAGLLESGENKNIASVKFRAYISGYC